MINQEKLFEVLSYDASIGEFTWKAAGNTFYNGKVAGAYDRCGYKRITFMRKAYTCHRLAWLYVYGEFPKEEIDHINGIRSDNRISNLRLADRFVNTQNIGIRSNNTSGITGVTYCKKSKKWKAQIKAYRKSYALGLFELKESAAEAYMSAKANLHKFPSRAIEAAIKGQVKA